MLHESAAPPQFFPSEFEDWADNVIGRGTVHASEIRDLYLLLTQQPPPSFLNTFMTTDSDVSD